MPHADFRFYGPLNDFLPERRRQTSFRHEFRDPASVKDMIESLGVPHPEVEFIVADDEPVDFGHRVTGGNRIAVYPQLFTFRDEPAVRAGPPPPAVPRFVLDAHLRRLAVYLRLLGMDTRWWPDADDADLAVTSREEGRILLTRDLGLLKRAAVEHGRFVRARKPRAQLREMVARYELARFAAPFSRCVRCNGEVEDVEKSQIRHLLEERTCRHYHRFRRCPACERIFWPGSHYDRLRRLVRSVLPDWRAPEEAAAAGTSDA